MSSPLEWPGVSSTRPLLLGERLEGAWVDRTRKRLEGGGTVASQDPPPYWEREYVVFEPIPCWRRLKSTVVRKRIAELVSDIETEVDARHRVQGSRPSGVPKVLRQDPHDKPLKSKWSPAPLVHCASREARDLLCEAYSSFVEAFRDTATRLGSASLLDNFPDEAFPPHIPYQQHARAPG